MDLAQLGIMPTHILAVGSGVCVAVPDARAAPGVRPWHKPHPVGGRAKPCSFFRGALLTFPLVLNLAASRPPAPDHQTVPAHPSPSLSLVPSATLTLSLYN